MILGKNRNKEGCGGDWACLGWDGEHGNPKSVEVSGKGEDGALTMPGLHSFLLLRPLSPFILKPQEVGRGLGPATA